MKSHIGERSRSRQGLTLEIKKWLCREKVEVQIIETGERRWVTYRDFRRGMVYGNFLEYPPNGDVPLRHAVVLAIGITTLILAVTGGLIYWICR